MLMNTPEGYISLADDPAAVLNAKVGKIPLHKIRDICMVSDGFAEYYGMFRLAENLETFMDLAVAKTPETLFSELLAAQEADATYEKHPRFKLSDDATILYAAL